MKPIITLSTGKVVETKEMTAYQSYLLNSFLTGSVNAEEVQGGNIPASVAFQMGTLETLFKVDKVNGVKVKTPTDKKALVKAFSNFSSAELSELTAEMSPKKDKESDEDSENEDEESGNSEVTELEKK